MGKKFGGEKMVREWSPNEEKLLKENFLNRALDDILALFPHRDIEQILSKARELDLITGAGN